MERPAPASPPAAPGEPTAVDPEARSEPPPVSRRALFGLVALVLAITAAAQWWAARQERALGKAISQMARPGEILMLSSDTCLYCDAARNWLTAQAVAFGECSIERDADCAARYRAIGAPGTPVLLVRGRAQLGFHPARLHGALAAPRPGA